MHVDVQHSGDLIKGKVIHTFIKLDMFHDLGMGSLRVVPNDILGSAWEESQEDALPASREYIPMPVVLNLFQMGGKREEQSFTSLNNLSKDWFTSNKTTQDNNSA
jgi:hypothetical protein